YAPYNALLNHVFPVDEDFTVSPQYGCPTVGENGILTGGEGLVDTGTYVIELHQHPVFCLEVKCGGNLFNDSTRELADYQMRARVRSLRRELIVPKLHGISAMAKTFAVYEYDNASSIVTPRPVRRDDIVMNDTAPIEHWQYDILEPQGEQRFRAIVADVKAMCLAASAQ
ncbi:hypothetical protein K439DRAFT_1365961, partial [Ramaria rubella]